ncbi:hypothetical protein L2E82_20864 [Cichorium intybus]|uniref:Uncharacterized protein n=1 Tax=Cichorium intybus TaxID=13427 RepID=A0ACB9DUU0_CICIN|nr:hypothetical protein L2E82_20864 [Cichorium intybus]
MAMIWVGGCDVLSITSYPANREKPSALSAFCLSVSHSSLAARLRLRLQTVSIPSTDLSKFVSVTLHSALLRVVCRRKVRTRNRASGIGWICSGTRSSLSLGTYICFRFVLKLFNRKRWLRPPRVRLRSWRA